MSAEEKQEAPDAMNLEERYEWWHMFILEMKNPSILHDVFKIVNVYWDVIEKQ